MFIRGDTSHFQLFKEGFERSINQEIRQIAMRYIREALFFRNQEVNQL